MPKPTVTMLAKKAKRYNRVDLQPDKTFQARPGDVKFLRMLGWAVDAPPAKAEKAASYQTTSLASAPVAKYQTTALKPTK